MQYHEGQYRTYDTVGTCIPELLAVLPTDMYPAGQSEHCTLVLMGAWVPGLQKLQLFVALALEYVPGTQGMHRSLLLAPLSEEAFPTLHSLQSVDPPSSEYVPGLHSMHVLLLLAPSASEKVPALHNVQLSTSSDPTTTEYVPALHRSQSADPGSMA